MKSIKLSGILKKLTIILNVVTVLLIVGFISFSTYRYFDYRSNPELYELYSAPWHADIQLLALLVALVLLLIFVVKLFINKGSRSKD